MGHESRSKAMAARRAARWARIKTLVDASIAQRMTVEDLAKIAGLSPFHFSREFQKALGLPPHAYLTQRRLAVARDLIAQGAMPLAAIAKATGFMTPSHFSNVFRREMGMTPSSYGKRLRTQAAAPAAAAVEASAGDRDHNFSRQAEAAAIGS
jgi:AraC-like DNA-binding protein